MGDVDVSADVVLGLTHLAFSVMEQLQPSLVFASSRCSMEVIEAIKQSRE